MELENVCLEAKVGIQSQINHLGARKGMVLFFLFLAEFQYGKATAAFIKRLADIEEKILKYQSK